MSALGWGFLGGIVVVCLALVIAWQRSVETDAARAERASRPDALRDAELVYMERLFRTSEPVGLVAKIDRAYRMPVGLLVLVELKTRWANQPSLSDVIQLSAQRVAVMGQTKQIVACYAYIMVKAPIGRDLPIAHRVQLMTDEQVVALVKRREDIFAGRALPRSSYSQKACLTCMFRAQCDHPVFEGARHELSICGLRYIECEFLMAGRQGSAVRSGVLAALRAVPTRRLAPRCRPSARS